MFVELTEANPRLRIGQVVLHGRKYKRVKGISHTVEKRTSMQPHKPHATSQPLRMFSHTYTDCAQTHHTTSIPNNSRKSRQYAPDHMTHTSHPHCPNCAANHITCIAGHANLVERAPPPQPHRYPGHIAFRSIELDRIPL